MSQSTAILVKGDGYRINKLSEVVAKKVTAGSKGVMLLLTPGKHFSDQALTKFLKELPIPAFGGLFPEVAYGGQYHDHAGVIIFWDQAVPVELYKDISKLNSRLYSSEREEAASGSTSERKLVFLSSSDLFHGKALNALYYQHSGDVDYVGAVAGFANDSRKPAILCNEGILSDAMLVASPSHQLQTVVSKGWNAISGPHLVTASRGNYVSEIDYQSIDKCYQQILDSEAFDHLHDKIKGLSLEQIVACFPFGIKNIDEDMLVHDVTSYNEQGLQFRGGVPMYSNLYVLSGEADALLTDISDNLDEFTQSKAEDVDLALMFNCQARRRRMVENSDRELRLLDSGFEERQALVGAVSRGELASNSTGYVRLLSHKLVMSRLVA